MPSRFEPCGLNQLFSLRYGTVPVVHRTGGLADTVVDATDETIAAKSATGFVFDEPSSESLWGAIERALAHWRQPGKGWQQLAVTGMQQDYSWSASARRYVELYEVARRHTPGAA
jgi:starch synthase